MPPTGSFVKLNDPSTKIEWIRCTALRVKAHLGLLKGPTLFAYNITSSPALKLCDAATAPRMFKEKTNGMHRAQRAFIPCGGRQESPGAQRTQLNVNLSRIAAGVVKTLVWWPPTALLSIDPCTISSVPQVAPGTAGQDPPDDDSTWRSTES